MTLNLWMPRGVDLVEVAGPEPNPRTSTSWAVSMPMASPTHDVSPAASRGRRLDLTDATSEGPACLLKVVRSNRWLAGGQCG